MEMAIRGNDSLYVVQKAFRFDTSKERIEEATRFLRAVLVCDTRTEVHPCPKLESVVTK